MDNLSEQTKEFWNNQLQKPLNLKGDFETIKKMYIEFDNNDIYHKSAKQLHQRLFDFCCIKGCDFGDMIIFANYVKSHNINTDL